jgi:hypothetical protein
MPVQSIAKQYASAARCNVSIITYGLPRKRPLHANTTQIVDVRVQEDRSRNPKYYIHYIHGPTCRGSAPLYAPPLSYKRGGMRRYRGTEKDGQKEAHLDLAQAHKFKQAQYMTQWSRVLCFGIPNHSKLLRVLEFIVHLPTGKTLKPPPHIRI